MAQDFVIARFFDDGHPFLAEHPRRPHRIRAARLHVNKEQVLPVLLQRHPHVFRLAGIRVEITARQHTADLVGRVDLMGDFGHQRAGDQLVVGGLIFDLLFIFALGEHQPGAPVAALQAAVAAAVVEQVAAVDVVLVAANAGDQGQALGELGAVFGEQGEGAGFRQRLRLGRAGAMEGTGRGLPRIERVCAAVVVGPVAVDVEADAVVLGTDHGLAGQAEQ